MLWAFALLESHLGDVVLYSKRTSATWQISSHVVYMCRRVGGNFKRKSKEAQIPGKASLGSDQLQKKKKQNTVPFWVRTGEQTQPKHHGDIGTAAALWCFVFWDKILFCSPGWPCIHGNPHTSASQANTLNISWDSIIVSFSFFLFFFLCVCF